MKNILIYNYGLNADDIIKTTDGYRFYEGYQLFFFNKTILKEDTINYIVELLKKHQNNYFKFIINREGKYLSKIENETFVLLKPLVSENIELNLRDIINNNINVTQKLSELDRSSWSNLWSKKVDYLEYQVSELAVDYPIIKSSFSYYVGLAENAIEYFNAIDNKSQNLVLSHKRIFYPNVSKNYYNPATIIIDYRVRDIGEYLKCYFFNSDETINFNDLIKELELNNDEYNLLIARLLYPSYYFDELSDILEHKKSEDNLLKYIDKIKDYERFLKDTLNILSKKAAIIKIDWLL